MAGNEKVRLDKIKMLITDVDGVLTDGGIIVHGDGSESKRFNVQDGHGIKLWQRAGFGMAIISGRTSKATEIRGRELGIENVMQGCKDKVSAFESLLDKVSLSAEEVAYIGDDLGDMPIVKRAGFGVAVVNAVSELKSVADYVTETAGGYGAVREVIEYILKSTGKWDGVMERYLI